MWIDAENPDLAKFAFKLTLITRKFVPIFIHFSQNKQLENSMPLSRLILVYIRTHYAAHVTF